jgi:hypothetical protein
VGEANSTGVYTGRGGLREPNTLLADFNSFSAQPTINLPSKREETRNQMTCWMWLTVLSLTGQQATHGREAALLAKYITDHGL